MERLQKLIAQSGFCSRRKAEELISEGRVKVNGKVVTELGTKADVEDIISVDGKKINMERKVYILMNKPRNVVCSAKDDRGRKTVVDLIEGVGERIYPIGRLDFDTTGVLLLTNDGDITNKLIHPSKEIDKTYRVTIEGFANEDQLERIRRGIKLDGVMTSEAIVEVSKINKEKRKSIINITIHEGKNHQVKRMFNTVGLKVVKLNRIEFAGFKVGGLKEGQYRLLTNKEITELKSMVK